MAEKFLRPNQTSRYPEFDNRETGESALPGRLHNKALLLPPCLCCCFGHRMLAPLASARAPTSADQRVPTSASRPARPDQRVPTSASRPAPAASSFSQRRERRPVSPGRNSRCIFVAAIGRRPVELMSRSVVWEVPLDWHGAARAELPGRAPRRQTADVPAGRPTQWRRRVLLKIPIGVYGSVGGKDTINRRLGARWLPDRPPNIAALIASCEPLELNGRGLAAKVVAGRQHALPARAASQPPLRTGRPRASPRRATVRARAGTRLSERGCLLGSSAPAARAAAAPCHGSFITGQERRRRLTGATRRRRGYSTFQRRPRPPPPAPHFNR